MSAICAQNISFAFGTKAVLRGISFDLKPGTITGLVGPNGAGKTTLLRSLAGLLKCAGIITYAGHNLNSLSPRALAGQRAFVPQDTTLPFPYSVFEVVSLGRAFLDPWFTPRTSSQAVNEVLTEVGFEPPASRFFSSLSGGERQQVLLARSLLQNAPVLLLDEPTAALDLRHRARVVAALRRRARSGQTVLLSMHDLNLAALACDELIVLKDGQIVIKGPPGLVLTTEILEPVYGVKLVCQKNNGLGYPNVQVDLRTENPTQNTNYKL